MWLSDGSLELMKEKQGSKELAKPVRMCVICRRRFEKPELDRHVLDGAGSMMLDENQKAPGRGWYCCRAEECRKKFALWKAGGRKRKSGGVVGR